MAILIAGDDMKTDGLFDPIYYQLERVMDLRAEQQTMLSGNLANASTPNYRAKEIDFSKILSEVMETPSASLPMTNTAGGHLGGLGGVNAVPEVTTHEPPPWSLDGNSVNPELENIKIVENSLAFGATTRATSRKLAMLKLAVTDGRG